MALILTVPQDRDVLTRMIPDTSCLLLSDSICESNSNN